MFKRIAERITAVLASGDMPQRRPALKANRESNVPGLYVAGAVVSGRETGRIFIENGRFHGEMIVKAISAGRVRA